jgi:hypothetical protein
MVKNMIYCFLFIACSLILESGLITANAGVLFTESFEDTNFSSRGWYDNTKLMLTNKEHLPNSMMAAEFRFDIGATRPTSGGAIRKKIIPSDSVYVSYWVKYSTSWTGSNRDYHPHEFMLMTNRNGDYDGLAFTHLTVYMEQNEGTPLLAIQDGQNIDVTKIGSDMTKVTENRAVAGCNGDSDGYGSGSCYSVGGGEYWNGKGWKAGRVYFSDTQGVNYKSDWHFIETYVKLNSISGGKGVKDGVLKYWYDGSLVLDYNNVVLRTGVYPDMKFNQFIIAPWIGDGSPVDQTFWIDDLTVATERPEMNNAPAAPEGLRVINQ